VGGAGWLEVRLVLSAPGRVRAARDARDGRLCQEPREEAPREGADRRRRAEVRGEDEQVRERGRALARAPRVEGR
jgi:hypothetical protein